MKLILFIIVLLFSLSSFAQTPRPDPDLCGGESSCVNQCRRGEHPARCAVRGTLSVLDMGVFEWGGHPSYSARGLGRTCDQAKAQSLRAFHRLYGERRCGGLFGQPWHNYTCYRASNGQFSAWAVCPDSPEEDCNHSPGRPPSGNSGAGLILLETLRTPRRR